MDFRERLLKELEELSVKINKLENYIMSNVRIDTDLETIQLQAMMEYRRILEKRILKLMNGKGES